MTFLSHCSNSRALGSHGPLTQRSWFRRPWEFDHDCKATMCMIARGGTSKKWCGYKTTACGTNHVLMFIGALFTDYLCSVEDTIIRWTQMRMSKLARCTCKPMGAKLTMGGGRGRKCISFVFGIGEL